MCNMPFNMYCTARRAVHRGSRKWTSGKDCHTRSRSDHAVWCSLINFVWLHILAWWLLILSLKVLTQRRVDRVIGVTIILSCEQVFIWWLRFVAVPTYVYFKTSVTAFIIIKKRRSTTVPFKTFTVNCHMRDLCQKVRHMVAYSQACEESNTF